MDKQTVVGVAALVIGVVLVLSRSYFAKGATSQQNVFGRANASNPSFARMMPVIVGCGIALCGVLVLVGILGVQ
ncbi:hypothetical protein GCM10010353_60830 [Streptomyces chryseus]|uniref:DUF3185 family protein n=1 Tax=Streptomyces chryseus TaxID=68186 RepID=A0ABQ3E4V4_9ACTN|nr:hypothetical protein GCM10010353_60830 [Streptomyces chryseus]GHB25976.1 hypothetical protein GCM10010346_56970 [Streptomyces chryseus]